MGAATSVVIRAGVASDAANLANLAARTFYETFAADNRPEDLALHMAHAYGISHQERELTDPAIATLLAEVDGQLAGYAQLHEGSPPACVNGEAPIELWRFYVAQPWHGRGVAQALMRAVETAARERGGRTLWLGVWERNDRAQAFYRKWNFHEVGEHIFQLGSDSQRDIVMQRAV